MMAKEIQAYCRNCRRETIWAVTTGYYEEEEIGGSRIYSRIYTYTCLTCGEHRRVSEAIGTGDGCGIEKETSSPLVATPFDRLMLIVAGFSALVLVLKMLGII